MQFDKDEFTEAVKMYVSFATAGLECVNDQQTKLVEQLREEVTVRDGTIREQASKIEVYEGKLAQYEKRMAALERQLAQMGGTCVANGQGTEQAQQQVVVVQQFFVLSVPKTESYVRTLDNKQRSLVCHMFQHTMAEGTPQSMVKKVNEMTGFTPATPLVEVSSPGNQIIQTQTNNFMNEEGGSVYGE